jgi:hypothetical protein
MGKYALSPQWRIEQSGPILLLTGGQDSVYTIELETSKPCFFASCDGPFDADILARDDQAVLEQLVSASIINPVFDSIEPQMLRVGCIGNKHFLDDFVDEDMFNAFDESNNFNLLLLLRTNETLEQFLEDVSYDTITSVHLFADFSFHHTLSIGPLVFPQQTSCVRCFRTRIASRWGDPQPPINPASSAELISFGREWIRNEIRKLCIESDFFLTNKTLTFDSELRSVSEHKLLTTPNCEYCAKTLSFESTINVSGDQ